MPSNQIVEPQRTPRRFNECPICRGQSRWRNGVHRDHEMICPKCHHTFDPHDQWALDEAERLRFNTFKE